MGQRVDNFLMFSAWYFVLDMISFQSITFEMNMTERVEKKIGCSCIEDVDTGQPWMG